MNWFDQSLLHNQNHKNTCTVDVYSSLDMPKVIFVSKNNIFNVNNTLSELYSQFKFDTLTFNMTK